jgi:hypothetical protein
VLTTTGPMGHSGQRSHQRVRRVARGRTRSAGHVGVAGRSACRHGLQRGPHEPEGRGRSCGAVDRWLSAWATSESAFVERVTSKLPQTPPNFARIVELNESGEGPDVDPIELEAGANRCAIR